MYFSLCWNLIMVSPGMLKDSSHQSFILVTKFRWVSQKILNRKGFTSLSFGNLILMLIG